MHENIRSNSSFVKGAARFGIMAAGANCAMKSLVSACSALVIGARAMSGVRFALNTLRTALRMFIAESGLQRVLFDPEGRGVVVW